MKKKYTRQELNKKIIGLKRFANLWVTSFVVVMFIIYLASNKQTNIWVILMGLLVVASTSFYCIAGLYYHHKLRQLDK